MRSVVGYLTEVRPWCEVDYHLFQSPVAFFTSVLFVRVIQAIILEWTKLVCTPALGLYTGMDE